VFAWRETKNWGTQSWQNVLTLLSAEVIEPFLSTGKRYSQKIMTKVEFEVVRVRSDDDPIHLAMPSVPHITWSGAGKDEAVSNKQRLQAVRSILSTLPQSANPKMISAFMKFCGHFLSDEQRKSLIPQQTSILPTTCEIRQIKQFNYALTNRLRHPKALSICKSFSRMID